MQNETVPGGGTSDLHPGGEAADGGMPGESERRGPGGGRHAGEGEPGAGAAERRTCEDQRGEQGIDNGAGAMQHDDHGKVEDHGGDVIGWAADWPYGWCLLQTFVRRYD